MEEISSLSRICLYILLGIMGVLSIFMCIWQIMVLRGKAMKNCDGSYDNWHEQKCHYGIAVADVYVAFPANIAGIVLVFLSPRWGCYLLALASFWWISANIMTTVNSLHFEKPKITFMGFLTYPFGILVGLAYVVWSVFHFNTIYSLGDMNGYILEQGIHSAEPLPPAYREPAADFVNHHQFQELVREAEA